MTNETLILETAYVHYETSGKFFEAYQNENDPEFKSTLWALCEEASGKADGLLEAYEILTGKKVYQHQIKETLLTLA